MDMIIENKKTIITVLVSFVLGALIWALISPAKTNLPNGVNQSTTQAKIKANSKATLARSGNVMEPQNIQRPTMPWDVAVNMIKTAPIEKIQVLTGLSIKLYLKGGPTFITDQPSKDAYIPIVKTAKNPIQIIK